GHLQRWLAEHRRRCDTLHARLLRQHPRRQLEDAMQRLDDAELRLLRAFELRLDAAKTSHVQLAARLHRATPAPRTKQTRIACDQLVQRVRQIITRLVTDASQRTNAAARTLHTLSPLQTLERGYAIARTENKTVLHN